MYRSNISTNQFNTPYLHALLATVEALSVTPYYFFLDADTFVDQRLMNAIIAVLASAKRPVFLTGSRMNVDNCQACDFRDPQSFNAALLHGNPSGAFDFFLYPRGFFRHMPPFLLGQERRGRSRHNNWMAREAISRGLTTIHVPGTIPLVPHFTSRFLPTRVVTFQSLRCYVGFINLGH